MHRHAVGKHFRVPLHAEEEVLFRGPNRLDDAVVAAPGADDKSGRRCLHGLMVTAVDGYEVALHDIGKERLRRHRHAVLRERIVFGLIVHVGIGAALRRQILPEGAAERRRDRLNAAADAEYGLRNS